MSELAAEWERTGIKSPTLDRSCAHATAGINQKEIASVRLNRQMPQRQCPDLLDKQNRHLKEFLQNIRQVRLLGPSKIRREEDALLGFIDNAGQADDDRLDSFCD